MTAFRLKHVDRFVDRHGHVRHYFRRNRGARILLPGEPGSQEFRAAYEAALAGADAPAAPKRRGAPGTFDDLLQIYFESTAFARLAPRSKLAYRTIAETLIRAEGVGHRMVVQMKRQHVDRMLAKRAATPAAANNVLAVLRILIRHAIDLGWRADDPTLRIRPFAGGEHHTWTDDEIAAFAARWPIGTRERTAFEMLLHTGQRIDDVRTMAWGHLEGAGINVVQGKTKSRLWIPLHPHLAAILAQWPRTHVAIITSSRGGPFSWGGFQHWLASAIKAAGLPERCVPHGLRKAAARRLAEAGCSAHQIASVTGHKTLREIERYTKAAEQRHLATAAMAHLQNKDSQPSC
jgi:integrase